MLSVFPVTPPGQVSLSLVLTCVLVSYPPLLMEALSISFLFLWIETLLFDANSFARSTDDVWQLKSSASCLLVRLYGAATQWLCRENHWLFFSASSVCSSPWVQGPGEGSATWLLAVTISLQLPLQSAEAVREPRAPWVWCLVVLTLLLALFWDVLLWLSLETSLQLCPSRCFLGISRVVEVPGTYVCLMCQSLPLCCWKDKM